MSRRPPGSTRKESSAASAVYKIQQDDWLRIEQLSGPFLVDGDIVGHPEVIELEVLARHFEVYLPR